MRFFPLALLGLASVAVAADPKSWNDLVGDVPSCVKSCLGDYYNDLGLQDKCGSSDSASIDCLCGADFKDISNAATSLNDCFEEKCDKDEFLDNATKLQDFATRLGDLPGQCEATAKNSASSIVPGLNAMVATGALMLVGVAL